MSSSSARRKLERFGEKLHTLRRARHLTLKELASALGYTSYGYISELEAGKKLPTLQLVLDVADFFNVTTDQLLKDELDVEINDQDREK
jgi:transcriptional regulator with XRE-family HTH domain